MKNRFAIVPLMLMIGLVILGGCSEQGDPQWGEKQKARLQELLDKPTITYGGITVDDKKKEWVVSNLEVVVYETEDMRSLCTIESVAGTDVALDPITEAGLLAKKLEIKGLECKALEKNAQTQQETEVASFRQDSAVLENLRGSKELQASLLSFGSNISWEVLAGASFDRLAMSGFTLTGEGNSIASLESFDMQNLSGGFAGPVQLKNIKLTPDEGGLKSITMADLSIKKIGSEKLFDLVRSMEKVDSLEEMLPLFMSMDFLAEDAQYTDLRMVIDESVPPIILEKATGSSKFDGQNGRSVSRLEGLTIAPETLQFMMPRELKDYPFKPLVITSEFEADVLSSDDGGYVLDYKKIRISDPNLVDMNLSMKLSSDKPMAQLVMLDDAEGMRLNGFTLSVDDFGLSDLIIDIVMRMGGESGADVQAMRGMASSLIKMQCGQIPAGLQEACNNTAEFIEKKGSIEYSFMPEQPLPLDESILPGQVNSLIITSKHTPAKQTEI